MSDSRDVGVVQVFRLKIVNHYNTKPIVPLLFLATLTKGVSPVYIQYEDLKQRYPQILINFLQTKLQIVPSSEKLVSNKSKDMLVVSQQQNGQKSILLKSANSQMIFDKLDQQESQQNKREQSRSPSQSSSNYSHHSNQFPTKQSKKPIPSALAARPIRSCRLKNEPSQQLAPAVKRFRQENKTKSKQVTNKDSSKQAKKDQSKHLDYDEIAIQLYGQEDYLYKYVPVLFLPKKKKSRSRRRNNNKSMSWEKRKKKGKK